MLMRESKLLMPYFSPHLAQFPDDSKEEADKGRVFWTTDRESIVGLGYNRNMIRAADVPKNFAELVRPENKRQDRRQRRYHRRALDRRHDHAKGEEYVKQLRGLDVKMHMISGGAMHELMAAGEMPMSISIFRNHVLAGQVKGRADRMGAAGPESGQCRRCRASGGDQQPHAALLFIDFLLSPEGQKIYEEKFRFAYFDQKLRLQTLVSRKRFDHRAVREGRGALEKAVAGSVRR